MKVLCREIVTGLRLYFRDRHALIPTAGLPILFLILFSYMHRGQSRGDVPFVDYVFVSVIGMSIGGTAFLNLSIALVEERDVGILKRLRGTPLRAWQFLGGKVLSSSLIIFMQVLLCFAVGAAFFELRIRGVLLPSLAILVIGILTFLNMGFCLAGLMKNSKAAEAWALALFFPMLFLGGGFTQIESLPKSLQRVAQVLPLTHFHNATIHVFVEGESLGTCISDLLILLGWTGVCFAVAVITLRWE